MIIESYKKGNVQFVHEYGQVFIDILQDIDIMLGTNKNFMLGPWLQSAKNLATTADEKRNYEFNARNQITLWGPDGQILDYAGNQNCNISFIRRWLTTYLFCRILPNSCN